MPVDRQVAVLGPLQSGVATRAFLGVELVDGQPSPQRPVVIVWMPDEVVGDPRRLARLQRETAFVTQLRHPNLIDVHGLTHFEEGWARIVEFIDGEPLSRVLADATSAGRSISAELTARVIVDVCEGVNHAHEEGMNRFNGRAIVHGGVRPDTLMVGFDGGVRVTGYGAAVLAPTADGVPVPEIFLYLAPEQILGGRATASPATDVYAIGAVLFEMLAGHPPFAGTADLENAVLAETPPVFGDDGLDRRLGEIAVRAMAKRGPDRFQDVEAMKNAVLDALGAEGVVLPGSATLAAFMTELIPLEAPERAGRKALLASAQDPDSVTPLTAVPPPSEDLVEEMVPRDRGDTVPSGSLPAMPPAPSGDVAPAAISPAPSGDVAPGVASAPTSTAAAPVSSSAWATGDTGHPTPDLPPPVPTSSILAPGPVPISSAYSPSVGFTAPGFPPPGYTPPVGGPPSPGAPGMVATRSSVVPHPPRVAPRSNPGQVTGPLDDPRLANAPVTGLPPAPVKASSPIRETSASITYFNRKAGDASRSVFLIVLIVAAALLAFIFIFPKAPPEGLDEPPSRARLPQELVKEALSKPGGRAPAATGAVVAPPETRAAVAPPTAAPAGVQRDVGAGSQPTDEDTPKAAQTGAETDPDPASTDHARPVTAGQEVTAGDDDQAGAVDQPSKLPAKPATLAIDSDPAVSVFVGERALGRTPITTTLPAGWHRLRLTDAATGINAYHTVRLRAGQRWDKAFTFGTCRLRVDAPEGAVIKLNARVLGTAPIEDQTIYEGKYLLRVAYQGAVWSERVDAPAGGRLTYTVTLKDAPR